MKKIILVCGLISGVILGVCMVASMAIFSDKSYASGMIYGYASMVLAFSLIFVGVKNFRDKLNDGTVSFGKAFKIGFYITLIGSTMYVIVWLIEYNFFIPDYMDKYAAHMIENIKSSNLGPLQVDAKIKEINSMKEMYKNPLFVILMTYLEVLPVGLIISLISAFILKRKSVTTNQFVTPDYIKTSYGQK